MTTYYKCPICKKITSEEGYCTGGWLGHEEVQMELDKTIISMPDIKDTGCLECDKLPDNTICLKHQLEEKEYQAMKIADEIEELKNLIKEVKEIEERNKK